MTRVEVFTKLLDKFGYDYSPLAWHLSGSLTPDSADRLLGILEKER